MVNDRCVLHDDTLNKRDVFIELSTDSRSDKLIDTNQFRPSDLNVKSLPLPSNIIHPSDSIAKKDNSVQLYKTVFVARCPFVVKDEYTCDEGDEFELISQTSTDAYHVRHLRTNTKCTIDQKHLLLDRETPLRLGSDDRGVIQRCLLQHNKPGTYLIRRSRNELDSFVLSISQISSQTNAEDWHYLICIHPKTRCFYFVQESKLNQMFFPTFQKLVQNEKVREVIPLTHAIPHRIEFEEDLWHIPHRHLTIQYHIGNGEFGEVWRALWKNGNRSIPVAVKKLHKRRQDISSLKSYNQEIEAMKTLRNNYIVSLFGVAHDLQTNEILLVTELMGNGDLKNWLEDSIDVPEEKLVISFAYDICRGMTFLEQQLRVHRDLACRNILLGNEGRTVKIADFGLSTRISNDNSIQKNEIYYQRLPIRWTAPEVLADQKVYSIKSDVWSFGIVLIEIWLKGADPYPYEKDFSSIRALVRGGYVHSKPAKCSNQFYNRFILPCLSFDPKQRPNFKALVELLRQWHREKESYELLNSSYVEFCS
ncbi:unnamed protein product [Adineta ricciae]|uniref:non-specific protein-tyrosine kinase n=2 Tax=Adineta ricciae TaxID=249248 RepID=A0A814G4H7_ADIRI|nr:unnamed protein product [Adineta ricciae]